MTQQTRRAFGLSLGAAALAGCANSISGQGAQTIDARADATLRYMYERYPGTRDLATKAAGMLVMPLVTEVGLGLGGAYGRGVLRIGNSSVDYYSTTKASAGLQIGAQQYAHVLFFITPDALRDFRNSSGWAAGANIDYAISADGQTMRAETTTATSPVVAVIFGQAGLKFGATLDGVKYTRIVP